MFVKGKNVGIRLAGGNDVGIFVASVQEGSPAAKQGLKMGDKILSVNEVNFKNTVREDAVVTLMGLPVGDKVKIIAQAQPERKCIKACWLCFSCSLRMKFDPKTFL